MTVKSFNYPLYTNSSTCIPTDCTLLCKK